MTPPEHSSKELASLVDLDAVPRRLADGFDFIEGVTWRATDRSLCFNDIPRDTRWLWSDATGARVVNRPNFKANGQAYDVDGSLVVCEHISNSVVRIRIDGTRETLAFQYRGQYLNSPNDLAIRVVDRSIYFTDPIYGRADDRTGLERSPDLSFKGLFRITHRGGEPELLVDEGEFAGPNGICFSPQQDRLYVNDTDRGELKVWAVQVDGTLADRQVLCRELPPGPSGWLDGMECDELGNIWTSAPGGVLVVSPNGEKLGLIPTPEPLGSLVWGGEDLRSLFMASSTTLHVLDTRVAGARLPGNHVSPLDGA